MLLFLHKALHHPSSSHQLQESKYSITLQLLQHHKEEQGKSRRLDRYTHRHSSARGKQQQGGEGILGIQLGYSIFHSFCVIYLTYCYSVIAVFSAASTTPVTASASTSSAVVTSSSRSAGTTSTTTSSTATTSRKQQEEEQERVKQVPDRTLPLLLLLYVLIAQQGL